MGFCFHDHIKQKFYQLKITLFFWSKDSHWKVFFHRIKLDFFKVSISPAMVSRNIRRPSNTFSGIYMNGFFFFPLKVKTIILESCNGTVVLNIGSRNEILLGL